MNVSLKFALAAGSLMALTGGMVAFAQHHGGPDGQHPRLEEIDADGDGNVSRDEVDAKRSEKFAQADSDGDGVIGSDEFGARAGRMFDRADSDGDGVITNEERKAVRKAMKERRGKKHGHRSGARD